MNPLTKRKIQNKVALSLSTLAAAIGLFWLFFILWDVFRHGMSFITLDLFTKDPVPPGFEGGGLRNAFVGQILITLVAMVIGIPIGVLGGTFLS